MRVLQNELKELEAGIKGITEMPQTEGIKKYLIVLNSYKDALEIAIDLEKEIESLKEQIRINTGHC